MQNNNDFLTIIKNSFKTYLKKNTSRSTAKLKTLHGHIAEDLQEIYGQNFSILSQGIENDKEGCISGRYYNKNVDITILTDKMPVAGYAIKFVMRNYSQNSNNYFENMLGETANIRSNRIPYFQIFIIFEKVPYYEKGGRFKKYDIITKHNLEKYFALSQDNPDAFFHTPDKTLIVLLSLKDKQPNNKFKDAEEYANYYLPLIDSKNLLTYATNINDSFGDSVILNDYENFIKRTYHITMGKIK